MLHLYLVTDGSGSWAMVHEGPLPEDEDHDGSSGRLVALLGRFERRETALAALDLARKALGSLPAENTPEERARSCDFALIGLHTPGARPRRGPRRLGPNPGRPR